MSRVRVAVTRLRQGFLGDVVKLSFGTLAGRLIAVAALPALTRLYTPEDFSLLAVYLALVSTLSVAACLRLEIAIPLVETEGEAAELLTLASLVLCIVTVILAVPALVLPELVAEELGSPSMAPYLWMVPLGVLMVGSYSAMQFWATRVHRFGAIARTRIAQAVVGVSTMLVMGWGGGAPMGLLLGNMLNIGSGGLGLAINALTRDRSAFGGVRLHNLGAAFLRNIRYPIFSTPEALFNIAGIQVPVLLIAAHAEAEAGFLLLAMMVINAPMTLLGSSISQVYVSRAPQEYREGRLAVFTFLIMRQLIIVGAGPLVVVGMLAPWIFPMIFGAEWGRAGEIVVWLVPWMVLQFIVSPVSMVLHTISRQGWAMALQFVGVILRVGTVILAILADVSPVPVFALSSAAFYAVYAGVVIFSMQSLEREVFDVVGIVIPFGLALSMLGGAFFLIFS